MSENVSNSSSMVGESATSVSNELSENSIGSIDLLSESFSESSELSGGSNNNILISITSHENNSIAQSTDDLQFTISGLDDTYNYKIYVDGVEKTSNPQILNSSYMSYAKCIKIDDELNTVYVAKSNGANIYNKSDNTLIHAFGTYAGQPCNCIAYDDQNIYCGYTYNFVVYDKFTYEKKYGSSSDDMYRYSNRIYVDDNYIYLNGWTGFLKISKSDYSIQKTHSVIADCKFDGDLLYYVTSTNVVKIINNSDDSTISSITIPKPAVNFIPYSIEVDNDYIYVIGDSSGSGYVVRLNKSTLQIIDSRYITKYALGSYLDGNNLFIVSSTSYSGIFDKNTLSKLAGPIIAGDPAAYRTPITVEKSTDGNYYICTGSNYNVILSSIYQTYIANNLEIQSIPLQNAGVGEHTITIKTGFNYNIEKSITLNIE